MICTSFEKKTGKITGVFNVPEGKEDQQVSEFEDWIEGSFDSDLYRIENGIPVELPQKPSTNHIFDFENMQWVDSRTPESEWYAVREQRDRLLTTTDWTQLPDVPLPTKEAWASYRQALRDITLQPDPFNIVWPQPPISQS